MLDFQSRSDLELCHARCYVLNPVKIDTLERCKSWDEAAVRYIAELEAAIADLKEYRRQVAARAMALSTAVYDLRLSLTRHRYYRGSVEYRVLLEKVYADPSIPPQALISETYPGTERHKARARYAALLHEHPGIDTFVDIEKRQWER